MVPVKAYPMTTGMTSRLGAGHFWRVSSAQAGSCAGPCFIPPLIQPQPTANRWKGVLGQSIIAPVLLNEGGSPSCEGAGGLAVGPHRVCQASGQAEGSLPSGPPPGGTLPPPGPARDLPEGSLGLPLLIRIPAHHHVVGGALQVQVCMEQA